VSRLNRLPNDAEEVARQFIEVRFLTQPLAERIDRLLRVVLTPVEPPVDEALHEAQHWTGERGCNERGECNLEIVA
jgi:hypothetical protein